jgi:SRSO17 transposase
MSKRKQKSSRRHHRPAPPSSRKAGARLRATSLIAARQELITFHQKFMAHFDRVEQQCWSAFYLCGQLANLERKTIEPMVLALLGSAPEVIRAVQQFIGQSPWAVQPVTVQLQALVAEWLGDREGVVIADGSGFPKRGGYSAGVAWQYCGRLGKVENCQEGLFLVYASPKGHAFLNAQLYLPEKWFAPEYAKRWKKCGIPAAMEFQTEPAIALTLIRQVVECDQVPFRWVTADEDFGRDPGFLDGLTALGKWYLVEVPASTRVWRRTPCVQPPGPSLIGRPRLYPRVPPSAPPPQAVEDIATHWPTSKWKRRCIQEGSRGPMWAEFIWLRVTAIRNKLPGPRQWLVIRRNLDKERKFKYYLSNAPADCPPEALVRLTGYRWPIETALEEAKGEVGMTHYETRSWSGWHHHMVQTFMAHLFLVRLQQLLQKKSSDHDQPSAPAHRPSDDRRVQRKPRYARLSFLLAKAKSSGVSLTSQAHSASAPI